ncbi:polyprenol monophosphomannose synthase [Planosporangium thailandense]|uniref:Polyprenol monophosphomannose synthase n=1 Tax=Planosporangium thailandense TaxID=765197 RepID=A0ABX0XYJ7_9ACTN|nr:polyprenol monophosphomannose synthase [Planosporangium thailandense]NJC71131.1 polyprenol monophosphomannose synthase [Planosporangium thailandense]
MDHDVPIVTVAVPNVTVVVPTYNERDNLVTTVAALRALPLPNLRVLVVDDDSPDGTGELAGELARQSPRTVAVLHRTTKDGLGRAYVAGITRALDEGADIVIQMDADQSHPADAIPGMVAVLADTDAAVVLGSRYVRGGSVAGDWGWRRKALSVWANGYVNAILRLGVRDATAGFKAWRADVLRAIDVSSMRSNGYAFQVEMNYRTIRHGMRIVEVPIRFRKRAEGASKMSLAVQFESALMPWKLRFGRNPVRPRHRIGTKRPERTPALPR